MNLAEVLTYLHSGISEFFMICRSFQCRKNLPSNCPIHELHPHSTAHVSYTKLKKGLVANHIRWYVMICMFAVTSFAIITLILTSKVHFSSLPRTLIDLLFHLIQSHFSTQLVASLQSFLILDSGGSVTQCCHFMSLGQVREVDPALIHHYSSLYSQQIEQPVWKGNEETFTWWMICSSIASKLGEAT